MNNDLLISHFLKKTAGQPNPNVIEHNIPNNEKKDSSLDEFQEEMLKYIEGSIPQHAFDAFFKDNIQFKAIETQTIKLLVSTNFIKKILEEKYSNLLQEASEFILGKVYQFNIEVMQNQRKNIQQPPLMNTQSIDIDQSKNEGNRNSDYNIQVGAKRNVKDITFSIQENEDDQPHFHSSYQDRVLSEEQKFLSNAQDINPLHERTDQHIDVKKTFDNFIVGQSNNLAHASAVAVAREPGLAYPCLYLYGNSGLGKTHLLHAIGNHIKKHQPHLSLSMVSGNELLSQIITAYTNKEVPALMDYYTKKIDVLMIDDIHELKDRSGPQNQFFQIFNELQKRKKQIIVTSDKDPKDITGIEERVKSRLASTLTIEIQQPDLETRIAILKKKALSEDLFLPDDVIKLIARCIKNNIRELEGSLVKLAAWSSVYKTDIDLEVTKELLKISEADQEKTVTMESIAKTVSNYFKIPVVDLKSKVRNKDITVARHIAMYLSYFIGKSTLADIGFYYGRRDHTTVMHAVNKIKNQIKEDPNLSQQIYDIETQL